jgi:hypothetical protein
MFGHQDDKKDHDKHDEQEQIKPQHPAEGASADDAPGMDEGQHQDAPADDSADGGQSDGAPVDDDQAWQHPGEPSDNHSGKKDADDKQQDDDGPEQISDIIGPAGGNPDPMPPMPINARDLPDDNDSNVPHELIDIKQKALTELKPMLSQLDLAPEDKFRTLMMIIQASDNQDLIKQAYDVAEDIKDEKARAQALLDLVNEINYFTQHSAQ